MGLTILLSVAWLLGWGCSEPNHGRVCAMFHYVSYSLFNLSFVVPYSGLDLIIARVDDEECNDVGFKDALVMQDIQPIGALARVVLGTLMKQPWVPYEYKCLLFCFATDPTEDEVHHAFCRLSCNRHVNIFQMWIWLDFSMIDKGAFPMFNCQFMRNTSTYTLSLSICRKILGQLWSDIWLSELVKIGVYILLYRNNLSALWISSQVVIWCSYLCVCDEISEDPVDDGYIGCEI